MNAQNSGTTIVRVREVVSQDLVVVVDVENHGPLLGPNDRIVKCAAMATEGVDTFWKVCVDGTPREKSSKPRNAKGFALAPTPVMPMIEGSSASFVPQLQGSRAFPLSAPETKSSGDPSAATPIKEAVRLHVGYRPSGGEIVDRLAHYALGRPLKRKVDAIEISSNEWVLGSVLREEADRYGLAEDVVLSALPVWALGEEIDLVELGGGLVAFSSEPTFVEIGNKDFRTDDQILKAADDWLDRISKARSSTEIDRSRITELRELLEKSARETVSARELADLSASLRILAERPALIEILPDLLAGNPDLKTRVDDLVEAGVRRKLGAFDVELTEKRRELEKELADSEALLESRRRELALLDERERAYRRAVAEADATIGTRVERAIAQMQDAAREDEAGLRAEIDGIRAELAQMSAGARSNDSADPVGSLKLASAAERCRQIHELAAAWKVEEGGVLLAASLAFDGPLPVFCGRGANSAATDLATAISGGRGGVLHCDPTLVSVEDILTRRSVAEAVDRARRHPEAAFALALCQITKSPCEFWLPSLVSARQTGQLPANIALIGSAGGDGARIEAPDSLLDELMPIGCGECHEPAGRRPSTTQWPALSAAPEEKAVAYLSQVFSDIEVEDRAARKVARNLVKIGASVGVETIQELEAAIRMLVEWHGTKDRQSLSAHTFFQGFGE